jgi:regulator of replication initiation timing
MNEFIQKLEEIEEKLQHVSNQMQELREAVRESSNEDSELPVRELYEHPWYKYKREVIKSSGDYYQSSAS